MPFPSEPFINRLQKNQARLGRWAAREHLEAWRLYDRDMPEYPFAVDRYGEALVLHYFDRRPNPKLFSPEADEARAAEEISGAMEALRQWSGLEAASLFLKRRRARLGGDQYEKLGTDTVTRIVGEQGLRFLVNLSDYLDTGLFLDHRKLRARVREMAEGQRVLNLFAYTGAISVYACAGGAREVVTVDLSHTYLDWARENLKLNGFDSRFHPLERADVLQFLAEQKSAGEEYDLVVCDPPSFSNSKKMQGHFDVQVHHVALIRACLALLRPGGRLLFSCNLRSFVLEKEALSSWRVDDLTQRLRAEDFRDERVHHVFQLSRA